MKPTHFRGKSKSSDLRWIGFGCFLFLGLAVSTLFAQTQFQSARKVEPNLHRFRNFDDTTFTVAYHVFLEAQNLLSAFELAKEAVRQRPDLPLWRERLARTSEWMGDPELAQHEWERLGASFRQPNAYREALRLAALLHNPSAAVRAWEGLDEIRSLDSLESKALLDAYENSGQMDQCIRFLQKKLNHRFSRNLAMTLVEILLRTDNDQVALELIAKIEHTFGVTLELGIQRAKIHMRHGKMDLAALVLDSLQKLPRGDTAWAPLMRLQASVYSLMQRHGDALNAYRQLFQNGQYTEDELREMNTMARPLDQEFAVRTAIAGWTKFQDPNHLIYYLETCIDFSRWDLASQLLSKLNAEHWILFENSAYFFILASRIHQHEGKAALARKEYRHALALEPGMEEYRSGYLWLLIEQARKEELAILVDSLGQGELTPKTLLEPLASALRILQRPNEALTYYRLLKEIKSPNDFPFLLQYADLLKEAGDGGAAERAFLQAQVARQKHEQEEDPERQRDWQEANLKWSHSFGLIDRTEASLESMQRRFPKDRNLDELAFQWKIQRGENPDDAIPSAQDHYSTDQVMSGQFQGGVYFESHPHFEERKTEFSMQFPIQNGIEWSAQADIRQRPWISRGLLVPVANHENAGKIALSYSSGSTKTRLSLGIRKNQPDPIAGMGNAAMTFGLESEWQPMSEVLFSVIYARNTRAEENPILALASLKDYWHLDGKWMLPAQTEIAISGASTWFRSWNERFLGRGYHFQSGVEHHLFQSLSVGTSMVYHHFQAGQTQLGPQGQNWIGGMFPIAEFPRSYGYLHLNGTWQKPGHSRVTWYPEPFGSLEVGRNFFPSTVSAAGQSSNEMAIRLGLAMQPGPFQRLTILTEHARGMAGRQESTTTLSVQYGYSLN